MLIDKPSNEYSVNVNVTAFVDDFSAAGNLQDLRKQWSVLTEIDLKFNCYPKPTKTWLDDELCASDKIELYFLESK